MKIDDEQLKQLCDVAINVARNSYSPYSKFRVGAAVLGEHVHVGVNVENASYGLTLCAERSALSAAVAAGDKNIRAIAIACIDGDPNKGLDELMPCGGCLQWIQELAPQAKVVICGVDGQFTIEELLPKPFKP